IEARAEQLKSGRVTEGGRGGINLPPRGLGCREAISSRMERVSDGKSSKGVCGFGCRSRRSSRWERCGIGIGDGLSCFGVKPRRSGPSWLNARTLIHFCATVSRTWYARFAIRNRTRTRDGLELGGEHLGLPSFNDAISL